MTYDDLILKLKNEGELYSIFYKISAYSTYIQSGLIKTEPIKIEELVPLIKSEIL